MLEKERKVLTCCGLAPSDYLILSRSNESPYRKMSEIAKEAFLSRSAITYGVDRLVVRNLVKRFRSKGNDRRIVSIKITTKGRLLLKRVQKKQKVFLKNGFNELPEDVRKLVAAFSPPMKA